MKIALIAAVARNSVIGADQTIPWRIPSDFAWFKATTMDKPMIMGRKQFETFPKPLPGRPHIVVTRQENYTVPDGVYVRNSLETALDLAKTLAVSASLEEVMVIGGGELYKQAMDVADRLYISHVELEPEGDVVFPKIDADTWHVVAEPTVEASEKDGAEYSIKVYERRVAQAH